MNKILISTSSINYFKFINLLIFFIAVFFSTKSLSEIELITIDSFRINSMGQDSLMISKKDDANNDSGFFFLMERPFCLCERVAFVQQTPDSKDFIRPEEDSFINGTMRVDFKKAKQVEFEVFLARPNKSTNIIEPQNFPSIRNAKFIEINTVYGKDRFILEGFKDAMKQATKMCESFIPYIEKKVKSEDMNV